MMSIKFVTEEEMTRIIDDMKNPDNFGLFVTDYQHEGCTACDNSDGNAWTEDFTTLEAGIEWLQDTGIDMNRIFRDTETGDTVKMGDLSRTYYTDIDLQHEYECFGHYVNACQTYNNGTLEEI